MSEIAVVFPGQGSQRVGMAKEFFDTYPESKDVFNEASQAIEVDMVNLCFTENDRLGQTEFTQPAILTAEIAMLAALKKHFNFKPGYFAGHSLGEYTALVAAEVVPLADAVKIVRKRGALMQRAVPVGVGAMAALIQDDIGKTDYQQIVTDANAEVANFNSTSQVVISGRKAAVDLACQVLREAHPEMTIIGLDVSAPFHCSLMRDIETEFEEYLRSFTGNMQLAKSTRVISNFFGSFHTEQSLLEGLVSQISGSVLWLKNMEALSAVTGDIYEIGPGRILSKFFNSLGVTAKSIVDFRSLKKVLPSPLS
jgi:malonyl CoA-acyl carrier protein transacylase